MELIVFKWMCIRGQALAFVGKMQTICCKVSLQIKIFSCPDSKKVMEVAAFGDFVTFGIDLHATN